MPAKSQSQQQLFNWVHAIQEGKAKGSGKVNEIAKDVKPSSVEHFMSGEHIDKSLPKKASALDYLRAIRHIPQQKYVDHINDTPAEDRNSYEGTKKQLRTSASTQDTYKERLRRHKAVPSILKNPNYYDWSALDDKYDQQAIENYIQTTKKATLQNYIADVKKGPDKKFKVINRDMNKEAFERGFIKAAIENNINPIEALALLKQV
ncbi:hypothetical protein CCP3SC5AM1_1260010 [Gammaproteobacteria bacterium]